MSKCLKRVFITVVKSFMSINICSVLLNNMDKLSQSKKHQWL